MVKEQITAESETGWTNKFTGALGYYWLRERGEDAADASIMEYQGGERAYITGADDNFYQEWTSARFEFLGPLSPSDTEQLIALRKAATNAIKMIDEGYESMAASLLREALQVKAEMKGEQL